MKNLEDTRDVPFDAHVELLRGFLVERAAIVERIEGLLNAQRRPAHFLRDRRSLARHFEDCFFAIAPDRASLRGQLEQAHWARGFKPRELPGMSNDLIDPAEMMVRGFHLWTETRWPGRNGRVRYAHTLFNVYLTRQLAWLSMRVWDTGASHAGERLSQVQHVLDALWRGQPADQPTLVRDAHWLIPLAQSPGTEQLEPYFEAAEQIAECFSGDDRTEIHDAVVRMAGGHLRSYLHYYITQKGAPLDERRLTVLSRKSNALDYSLLIQGLVPLLGAYERAVESGAVAQRRKLADAICQGISPDPDLFINRVELLGAYSMVEYLFTATDDAGHAAYTPTGARHVRLLEEYAARIARIARPLHEDCAHFEPAEGAYSPYGLLYGVSSNLLEHMTLKMLTADAITRFSLEDAFTAGDAEKLAWADGWRKLPHVDADVQALYAYPHAFAAAIFERVERALRERASRVDGGARAGRLFLADEPRGAPEAAAADELPVRYVGSSDPALVAAGKAQAYDAEQLASDRLEGHFLVCYQTPGGSVAITKDLLTEELESHRDVRIAGLPRAAAESLRLVCRKLVAS